ncbi:hypothetical protein HOLleu_23686 [Holothuria leucospilota]|uniref:Reverse transcriptase domain-containing protein n=1 Tax=Holothuria leucospilota TaxID=206669 RepID=A0A9Q1BVM1_HOLLE|nr:hypothetical protein HOLleu_23686 [Holothuria leucospilota]
MEEINKQKVTRRNRKGVLTRTTNKLSELLKGADYEAIQETLEKANGLYERVEEAHADLVNLIEKDEEFEVEEKWMLDCQKTFISAKNETKEKLKGQNRPNIASVNEGQVPTQELSSEAAQVEQSEPNAEASESLTEQENSPSVRPKDEQCKVEMGQSLSNLFEVFSLTRLSPKPFNGDPLYFHSFVTSFTNMTSAVANDSVRLHMLMSRCEGQALEAIQFCNIKAPEEGFKAAMKTLEERYGDSARVAQAWIKKVTNSPKVDAGNIQKFADDLDNCYEALNTLGYISELNNQASLKQIMAKVPRFLQNRWSVENFKIKKERGKNAELKDVVKFIRKAIGSNRSGDEASGVSNRPPNRKDSVGNKIYHVNQGQTETTVKLETLCVGCNENSSHRLWECDSFRKLSVESRDVLKNTIGKGRQGYVETVEPKIYEFNRVVFGLNVAPFISQIVTQENARKHKEEYPCAAEAVLKSTYMDDTMVSVENIEKAVKLYHELRELWGQAGMEAKKWLSNSKQVIEQIPQELRVKEVNLTENELPSVSTLGLSWAAEQDHFKFKTSADREVHKEELTKRQVLSKISTVFDLLGFLSPFVIQGKILMQEIWVNGISWDEVVGGELQDKVGDWIGDLENLSDIRVNRCLCLDSAENIELHTFADGSCVAYGAVTYLRSVNSSGQVDIQFVASKTKVAPIKVVSIPRLELMAAVVGLSGVFFHQLHPILEEYMKAS